MTNDANSSVITDKSNKSEDIDNQQVVILPRARKTKLSLEPETILDKLNASLPGHDYAKSQLMMSLEKIQLTQYYPEQQYREVILLYGNLGVGKKSLITTMGHIYNFPVIHINLEPFYYSESQNFDKDLINVIFEEAHSKLQFKDIDPKRINRHERNHNVQLDGKELFLEPVKNAEFSIVYFENIDNTLLCHTVEQSERNYAMKFQLALANFLKSEIKVPGTGLTSRNMLYVLSGKLTKNNYIFSNETTVGFHSQNRLLENKQLNNDFKKISRKDLQEVGMNSALSNCITKIIGLENIKSAEFEASLRYENSFLNKNINLLKDAYNIEISFGDDSIKRIAAHLEEKRENYIGIKETIDTLLCQFYLTPSKFYDQKINFDSAMIDKTLK